MLNGSGQLGPLMNDCYPDIRPTGVREYVARPATERAAIATSADSDGLIKRSRDRSLDTYRKRITVYAKKCRSELCRNCVRSPRKHPQTPTFTGSHQEAFCGGKSLNRLCEEMFRCCSMQLAGIVFQACSIDHSDISPFRINNLRHGVGCEIADCDKSPNVPRSLTGFSSIARHYCSLGE